MCNGKKHCSQMSLDYMNFYRRLKNDRYTNGWYEFSISECRL
eukprot:gene15492-18400_t